MQETRKDLLIRQLKGNVEQRVRWDEVEREGIVEALLGLSARLMPSELGLGRITLSLEP